MPALAPVKKIAPRPFGSIRLAACWAAKNAPNVVIAIDFSTAAGLTLESGPGMRDLALHVEEQLRHLLRLGGVDGEDGGSSLLRKRLELFDIASGETYLQADLR